MYDIADDVERGSPTDRTPPSHSSVDVRGFSAGTPRVRVGVAAWRRHRGQPAGRDRAGRAPRPRHGPRDGQRRPGGAGRPGLRRHRDAAGTARVGLSGAAVAAAGTARAAVLGHHDRRGRP